MEDILIFFISYLQSLNWWYILTFLICSYSLLKFNGIFNKIPRRYVVAIVGVLLGVITYFIESGEPRVKARELFTSYWFTFAFHKLLLDKLIVFIEGKFLKIKK